MIDLLKDLHFRYNSIDFNVRFVNRVNVLCSDSGTGNSLVLNALADFCIASEVPFVFANYKYQLFNFDGDVVLLDDVDLCLTEGVLDGLIDSGAVLVVSLHNLSRLGRLEDSPLVSKYTVHSGDNSIRVRRWGVR